VQSIFQRERKAHSLGVCIPEAGKRKAMEAQLRRKKKVRDEIGSAEGFEASGAFEVTGIFHVYDSLMLQGTVLYGAINKKSATTFRGIKLRVIDLQTTGKTPTTFVEGEQGAIFLRAEKGKYPIIKSGDVIEF